MGHKIAFSKSGFNILTETDLNNKIFDSDYNTLKYYLSGNAQLTINGDGTTQTIETVVTHSLGFVPFFVVFVNDPENTGRYNIVPFNNSFITSIDYASAYATSTTLILQFKANYAIAKNRTLTFYYKIFRNDTGL